MDTQIKGLDKLTALQTLSLSNNCLTELNELYYLRPTRFPKLKSVGLRGNPMTQVSLYQSETLVYMIESV